MLSSSWVLASEMDLSNLEFSLLPRMSSRIEVSMIVGMRRVMSFEVDSSLKERSPGWLDNLYEGVVGTSMVSNVEKGVVCLGVTPRLLEAVGVYIRYLGPARLYLARSR